MFSLFRRGWWEVTEVRGWCPLFLGELMRDYEVSYILVRAWMYLSMYHVFWYFKISSIRRINKVIILSRIDEEELHRFYTAARGDLSCLLSSLKRTIRWRETYYLFSSQELEKWSTLVFWHEFDVMLRPCLVIRLGLAMSNLLPHDRQCFPQAIGMNFFQCFCVEFVCCWIDIDLYMIGHKFPRWHFPYEYDRA